MTECHLSKCNPSSLIIAHYQQAEGAGGQTNGYLANERRGIALAQMAFGHHVLQDGMRMGAPMRQKEIMDRHRGRQLIRQEIDIVRESEP